MDYSAMCLPVFFQPALPVSENLTSFLAPLEICFVNSLKHLAPASRGEMRRRVFCFVLNSQWALSLQHYNSRIRSLFIKAGFTVGQDVTLAQSSGRLEGSGPQTVPQPRVTWRVFQTPRAQVTHPIPVKSDCPGWERASVLLQISA